MFQIMDPKIDLHKLFMEIPRTQPWRNSSTSCRLIALLLWIFARDFSPQSLAQNASPSQTPVLVNLKGTGQAKYVLDLGNDVSDQIGLDWVVNLQFTPLNLVKSGNIVVSHQASFTGNFHIGGTAERLSQNGQFLDTEAFDHDQGVSAPVSFPVETSFNLDGSLASLRLELPTSASTPYIYRLDFAPGTDKSTIWTRLRSPFIYQADIESNPLTLTAETLNAAASFSGRVLDETTRQPISGAIVQIGSVQRSTDFDGSFSVDRVPPGSLTVHITKAGYQTYDHTATMPAFFPVKMDFTLKSAATNNVDIAASIDLVPSVAPTLPGREVPVSINLENKGTNSAQGVVLAEVFLSSDGQFSSTDLKLDERILSIQIPAGKNQTFQYSIRLLSGPGPVLDRAGLRHLILRINSDHVLPDTNQANDVGISPCFWMGQVINVITHGFNPSPDWVVFRAAAQELGAKLTQLPQNSLLEHRVFSYPPEWDSRTGFAEAFACLFAAKIMDAQAENTVSPASLARLRTGSVALKSLATLHARTSASLAAESANRIFNELRTRYLIEPSLSRQFQLIHLIGHSRGAALNARLARFLNANGYHVSQFSSLDGFSTDWPDDAGMIGDISIIEEAQGDLKINYRVERDIANYLVDFVEAPNAAVQTLIDLVIGAIKEFGGTPANIVSILPTPGVRADLRKLDLRAPSRKAFGFKDVTVKGLAGFSNHLNIPGEFAGSDSRTLPIKQYLFQNFEGQNRNATGCAELTDFVFPPNWEDRQVSPQSLSRKAIIPSSSRPTGAGILDGGFEDLGQLNDDLRSTSALPIGDPFIDEWLKLLSDPATILGTLWTKTGQAGLESAGINHYVSLTTTTNTSIAQTTVFSPYAESLRFDLAVSQTGASNSFQVWQDNTLLANIPLGKVAAFQPMQANLSGRTGLGLLSFRLVGPLQSPATIFLDNIEIVYSRPRISSVEWIAGNRLKLSIEAKPGSVLSLEYSDDLKQWQELTLWIADLSHGDYLIPPQTNFPERFFRVKSY